MISRTPLNVLAVQSYGFIEDDRDVGSGAIGSRARILYAAMLVGAGVIPKDNLIAIFPQSLPPSPPQKYQGKGFSLGEMMAVYLKTRPEIKGVQIIHRSRSWGTLNDIRATCSIVEEEFNNVNVHVYFVTDPDHLKRVRIIWNKTHPAGWNAHFYGATFHQMTWRERWVKEPLKRIIYRFLLRPRR